MTAQGLETIISVPGEGSFCLTDTCWAHGSADPQQWLLSVMCDFAGPPFPNIFLSVTSSKITEREGKQRQQANNNPVQLFELFLLQQNLMSFSTDAKLWVEIKVKRKKNHEHN